ncbi:MAG TPA: glycosyltransferase [Bacillota bacterium]|nr:glycosyltransferase [Bacillota bacterium]
MKIGIVIPHIFMHRDILPDVIFSPAALALQLAEGLQALGEDVTLFSPGPVDTTVTNVTANLSLFEQELDGRGDSYTDLLKKHPVTFVSLARQVQAELIAKAYAMANRGELDVVHVYTNEEDVALPFAALCSRPVVFTHHDPFNFLVKYKNVFPKYKHLNWVSLSLAQRAGMPAGTNWVANVYHGMGQNTLQPLKKPSGGYAAYLGRIIEAKGVHLAIAAVQKYNQTASKPLTLKLAGKHYAGGKDDYWLKYILPALNDPFIEYVGFVRTDAEKQAFLGNARALIVPSTFNEPFGMVLIEALATGTPVIGLSSGAIPEIIKNRLTGIVVPKKDTNDATVAGLASALRKVHTIDRSVCRHDFELRFTTSRMCRDYLAVYEELVASA